MLSSVYDPLGLASPFILRARIVMQDLCRVKSGWDDPVGSKYEAEWLQWTAELEDMVKLKVPRCLQPPQATERQLHHFADASEAAYGVASYLRVMDAQRRVSTSLVMAKSHLAPIKPLTIPRLELQAATLATRQDALLRRELDVDLARSQYWTDSTIVLQYIKNTEKRFHTFVANRVAEIQGKTEAKDWHHVRTQENPANDTSRGVPASALSQTRWLRGPEFLSYPSETWPDMEHRPLSDEDPEVKRPAAASFSTIDQVENNPVEKLIAGNSNWSRLLRAVACFLLIPAVRLKKIPAVHSLQAEHLQGAEDALLEHVQRLHYSEEISALRTRGEVPRNSALRTLRSAFRGNLLVTSSRLTNAVVPEAVKCPVVVPSQHPIAEVIVRHVHERTAHSGREYVLAELRRKYWIIGASALVK